jgi:hypothetical protein
MSYLDSNPFKDGDKVKLIRAYSIIGDWDLHWNLEMTSSLNKIGTVKSGGTNTAFVHFEGTTREWNFPISALEKVEEKLVEYKFNVGDTVRITRNPSKKEASYVGWVSEFEVVEGKAGAVIKIEPKMVKVRVAGLADIWYPPVVLEPLDKTIIEKKQQMSNLYTKLQNQIDIKIGDYVKLTGNATDNQLGWGADWDSDLDGLWEDEESAEAYVKDIDSSDGYEIVLLSDTDGEDNFDSCNSYWVPFFVLEKVDSPSKVIIKLTDEYSATIANGLVTVGCQEIDFETVLRLAEAVKKLM